MTKNEERAIFRVRYKQLKQLLQRFSGSDKPDPAISSDRISNDLVRAGILFGLIDSNAHIRLTNKGREMLLAYENGQKEREKELLRVTFNENQQLRLHWALICDKKKEFTTSELTVIFRGMGYDELVDSSLIQYIRAFVDWAEAAGLCVKKGFEGHTYTILEHIVIGASPYEMNMTLPFVVPSLSSGPENALHLSILKLNAYICDFLADQTHQGDLSKIKAELENLRGSALVDDSYIKMLEREIDLALETKSRDVFAVVAQNLRDLRRKYVEEGQLS